MNRTIFIVTVLVLLAGFGCAAPDETTAGTTGTETVSTQTSTTASPVATTATETAFDYRQAMRDFVGSTSAYAKHARTGFIIIPQNGHDLILLDGGTPAEVYQDAIDGVGREDLFYGYDSDDVATPPNVRADILPYLDVALAHGEAESYRYYWRDSWLTAPPAWLARENPDWQAVIYGSGEAYLDRLLAAGFDGAYLDIINAFEYFEG